ncbi:MAG: carboxyl transferase domain-containing protein [Deinococcales bacterium]
MSKEVLAWMNELTAEMEERRKKIERGGGDARVRKQHAAGKMTARERLSILLDKDSFVELGVFTEHLGGGLMEGIEAPGEGVVTGYGT